MKSWTTLVFGLTLLSAGCGAPAWQQVPHDRLWQRAAAPRLHPQPKSWEPSVWYETLEKQTVWQLGRAVSPGFYVETGGHGRAALDVNAFGKVPDSTWFENRIGKRRVTAAEVARGPNVNPGPALERLVVSSLKTTGVTPGFVVEDAKGQRWIVKLDPPTFSGLASGAEMISTKLLWAAGYHVPENHLAWFDPDDVVLAPDATTKDEYERKVKLDRAELERTLGLLERREDGRVRALFSRFLPGKPLGPFPLTGTRPDDPNDRIPHERRRSLRGLRIFYAWLNNVDAKTGQSLDAFIEVEKDSGLGYVRHYILDFGTSLGSAASRPKPVAWGYDYQLDWGRFLARYASLGLYYPYWSELRGARFRSVGPFEAQVFEPESWRPLRPNPVFDLAQPADVFWAASILAHFDRELVAAAVRTAEYAEPGAADHVADVLLARRNEILRWAFRERTPLDNPTVVGTARVRLVDLEALAGLTDARATSYRWRLDWHRGSDAVGIAAGRVGRPSMSLRAAIDELGQRHAAALSKYPFLTLRVRRVGDRRPPIRVFLRLQSNSSLLPVGLEREP